MPMTVMTSQTEPVREDSLENILDKSCVDLKYGNQKNDQQNSQK